MIQPNQSITELVESS